MDFLREHSRFSMNYRGVSFFEHSPQKEQWVEGSRVTTVYSLSDGLTVTNIAEKNEKYGSYEWVNYIEYRGEGDSGLITELWDCDCFLDCDEESPREPSAYIPDPQKNMFILTPMGADDTENDFYVHMNLTHPGWKNYLFPDKRRSFSNKGGRSSAGNAPFFNVHQRGRGVIMAIGWSGQWNCAISRTENSLRLQSKIEDTHFILRSGEKIRTSSVVIMPYECNLCDSFNKWRRMLRESFGNIRERSPSLPFCAGIWGGMRSESIIQRIETIDKNGIPFEYVWIDAGWYGHGTRPTANEFGNDWALHTGDWEISELIHPNRMRDIKEALAKSGRKLILWFEPERCRIGTPIVSEHPEYFLTFEEKSHNYLLNLGNEEAFNYCLETLSSFIEELDIKCYRQDFNMFPLEYWRAADEEDRKGITEIKHITGLYRLWDTLLSRFPELIIDNCASGGKRIDIETLKRSIPLWRSDVQCPANPLPEATQMHTMSYSLWMPYHGSGTGRIYDTYRFRSTYAPTMTTNFTFSETDLFGDDAERMKWLVRMCEEYVSVRDYFDGDIYHLTNPQIDDTTWSITQWARPETGDGMIQLFRRGRSPFSEAFPKLHGISNNKTYEIRDIDGDSFTVSGKEINERGLRLTAEMERTAKIYIYREI